MALNTTFSLHFLKPTFLKPQTFKNCTLTPTIFKNSHFWPKNNIRWERLKLFSNLEEVMVEETKENETQKGNLKRKLFVLNLPWSYSVDDIKNVFGQCGIVEDVEIIKHQDGKNRGFAFVTMENGEEAQAVIDKFNSRELLGRTIKIEYANKFKRAKRLPVPGPQRGETRYTLYVSNLEWKVRSSNLKEFFGADFNPVSARVVFDNPSGKSAGYGFVSFATKEEAESALSSLNGKEILGRPVQLKFSEKNAEEVSDIKEEEVISEALRSS